jgi:hypothetical protein
MFIDGDADVYGVQYPPNSSQSAFLYNPISAAYTIMAQAPAAGGAFGGVNDSLQIVSLNIFYDFPAKKQITIKPPGTYDSEATANGVNDYAEIVGTWTDSSFVTHAFLACPTGFASGCPAL